MSRGPEFKSLRSHKSPSLVAYVPVTLALEAEEEEQRALCASLAPWSERLSQGQEQ